MSFFLYPGNKLETLGGICCRLIGDDPGSDPMAQETIVVQTQGMAAYLRQFFASDYLAIQYIAISRLDNDGNPLGETEDQAQTAQNCNSNDNFKHQRALLRKCSGRRSP